MSRLSVPNLETTAGPSGQIYAQIKKAIGSVPNTFASGQTGRCRIRGWELKDETWWHSWVTVGEQLRSDNMSPS